MVASSEWKGTAKGVYLPKAGTRFTSETDRALETAGGQISDHLIEDALDEEDWEGWQKLTKELGDRVQLR